MDGVTQEQAMIEPLSRRVAALAALLVNPAELGRIGERIPTAAEMAEVLRDISYEVEQVERRAADAEAAVVRTDRALAARATYSGVLERRLGIGFGSDLDAAPTVARIEDAREARRLATQRRLDGLFSPHPGPDAA
ncbi:hypothetical protein CCP2SC5_1040005 [Azospirillaceae bacterium]